MGPAETAARELVNRAKNVVSAEHLFAVAEAHLLAELDPHLAPLEIVSEDAAIHIDAQGIQKVVLADGTKVSRRNG